jgi:predicted DNA-binding transcriptional regulator AlpA
MPRKREIERPYAPDYVSAETLAYRLDYSRSAIDDYVRRGLLPKPLAVGAQARWRWADVESWIAARNAVAFGGGDNGQSHPSGESDPFLEDLKRGPSAHA